MSRNISLDILKLVLSFFVIGLHANFLNDLNSNLNYFSTNGLFRIAVPIFFIINGFFFLNVIDKRSIKKWAKRMISLYVFWMLFYIYFWFKIKNLNFEEISLIIKTLLLGYGHLWYVIATFQAGILLYLCKNLSILKLSILSIIMVLIGLILQYANAYQLISNIELANVLSDNNTRRNFLFFAFPFLSIGFIINKKELYKKITKEKLIFGITIGLILLIFENYLNYLYALKRDFDFLFSLLIICPLVFMLFYKITFNRNTKIIGLYANSIYFIHIVILAFLGRLSIFESTSITFLTILLSVVISSFLIRLNKKYSFIL